MPIPAPAPAPAPALPAPAPAPAPKPKGINKINYSPEIGLAVTTLNLLLDKKRVPKATNAEVTAAEEHLGDLAVKENLDKEDLARRIYAAPRRPLKIGELDYAERIILQANARANAAAAAAANFKTPVKGPPTFVLTPYKLDLKTRMTAEIANYKAIHNNNMPDPKTVAHMVDAIKQDIKEQAFRKKLADFEQNKGSQATVDEMNTLTTEHEQKFQGFGLKQTRIIKHKQTFNDKYAIDKKQLQKNILALKYVKNANNHATLDQRPAEETRRTTCHEG